MSVHDVYNLKIPVEKRAKAQKILRQEYFAMDIIGLI